MTALPAKTDLNGTPTTGVFKAAIGAVHDYLTGLFGSAGTPSALYTALKLLDPQALYNLALVPTVGANALTLTLKSRDGTTDLAAANPAFVGQRSGTLGSAVFNLRQLAANVALTISSGSTLGGVSGVPHWVYWYVIDNAGVQEPAVSGRFHGHYGIISTTAEGGGGGADSADLMYSAAARSNVAFRCGGRFLSTQPAAGAWTVLPSRIDPVGPHFMQGAGRVIGCRSKNNAVTPATLWDLNARRVELRDPTNGEILVLRNPNTKSVNIATAGPAENGRDQSGAFSTGWLHFYWIGKADGTYAGIASTAAEDVGPALPSGYTHWAYDSSVYWNSSALAVMQYGGAKGFYLAEQQVLNAGTATTETAVSVSTVVPPNALAFAVGVFFGFRQAASLSAGPNLRVVSGTDFKTLRTLLSATDVVQTFLEASVEMPNLAQQFYYLWSAVVTGRQVTVYVNSFTVPNGG